eukprot:gnl/Trimastix_PCT/2304.p1 GENE.gnl/Trimastix_PCT/2304~~gnl/Trimastix_PCT/2304.p1  ORF type:complete len:224 (-),score=29.42 gnl/Trimastix_PCT/2304:69-740(-)
MSEPRLDLVYFPVGPIEANCIILYHKLTKEAMIVDPGGNPERILGRVRDLGVTVKRILYTHGHIDHLDVSGDVQKGLDNHPDYWCPAEDKFLYEMLPVQCTLVPGINADISDPPEIQVWYNADSNIDLGDVHGRVIATPGHTPGSSCIYYESEALIFTGDTMFRQGYGRTDLPGGDFDKLEDSIKNKLRTLPGHTRVITGHGSETTIEAERNVPMQREDCVIL